MATRSKAFGGKSPRKSHLVKPSGGMGAEVYDARKDVEEAFTSAEGRPATDEYPELDYIDGAGPVAAGGDMVLVGRFLLNGQSFAGLDMDATHGLIFTSAKPGVDDNDITVELISGGATAVSYVPATKVLEVTFNSGVDDDDAIATAINANAAQTDGHIRAVSSGTINAAGIVAAGVFGPTNMTGGLGEGWECSVGGFEALPANVIGAISTATIAELLATVTVPALAPIVITDKAKIYALVDGVRTDLGAVAVE